MEPGSATEQAAPVAPFYVGAHRIDPQRGTITDGDGDETHVEPKVMDVLCMLAASRGDVVPRVQLVDTVWKTTYGGDESLSRAISILRRVFAGEQYIETVPKRGYRLAAQVVAAESSAPKETEAPAESVPTTPTRRATPRTLTAIFMALAVIAGIAALVRYHHAVPGGGENTVAVQPLETLIDDEQTRRFAAGTDVALRHALASAGVSVISSRAGKAAPAPEFLVNGAIDRDGEHYLATVHIDEAASHATLWSSRFRRDHNDMIALQSEIARRVASVMRCGLASRRPQPAKMNSDLLSLFLQVCDTPGDPTTENIIKSYELARRARLEAPDLAASQGIFAATNSALATNTEVTPRERRRLIDAARKAAARALAIDPNNGDAFLALAKIVPAGPAHWAEREAYLRKIGADDVVFSLALNHLVWLARQAGRLKEAVDLQRRVITLDPYSAFESASFAWLLSMTGKLREADTVLQDIETFWPNAETAMDYRLQIAIWRRPPEVAEALLKDRPALPKWWTDDDIACRRAFLAARAQRPGATIGALEAACRRRTERGIVVRMLASLGDVDGAWREAERVDFEADNNTIFLFFPEMRAFRADPRFMPLAKRIGLVDYWQATGKWPDFCAEPDLPYDCKQVAASL